MMSLAKLFQAANAQVQVQPLAEGEAAAISELANTTASGAAASPSLSVMELLLNASIPVQLVMLLLLIASLSSWVIIFRKKRLLDRAEKEADRFEERFWSGTELSALYDTAKRGRTLEGLEAIFEAGFREYSRKHPQRSRDSRAQLELAQRGMRVASARELDGLERNLEFLANVGCRLHRPVCGPARHRVGHHDFLPRAGQRARGDHRHRCSRHFRSPGCHRNGPVCRDPGGLGLQPLCNQGRARGRAL